jgi:LuxR family transcriptional regulator, maltose regulon positive regulatory protein
VREFSGSERTVAGYLLAEVLERQPADVRELLLRTSVLDRVSGPLADFVTGRTGSERILQELEDANAFVSSLDARRSWFRYHQLFAELLQLELRRRYPTIVGPLHRAAAQWYEQHGSVVEAIRHAQGARDWVYAARLLADRCVGLLLDGRTATVRGLLGAFPPDAATVNAELATAFASACIWDGAVDETAAYIELAERLAETLPVERTQHFGLPLATARLMLARRRGDLGTAIEAAQSVAAALQAQPASDRARLDERRATALMNLGVTELWSSRLDDARPHLAQAQARRARRPYLEITCLGHLGIAEPWSGRSFRVGLAFSEAAVRMAEEHGWTDDPVIAIGLATGAMALLWLGRFDRADGWLERARCVLHPGHEPGTELILHDAQGLLHLAQGRLEEALVSFRAAERMQTLLAGKHAFAIRTRARLVQTQARIGELHAARAALASLGTEERDTALIHVATAVVNLAEGEPGQAVDVLTPVTERGLRVPPPPWTSIEALLVEAAARQQLCDRRGSEASLERALELAETDGIVLPFMLAPVPELLERLPRHRTAHGTLLRTILDMLAGISAPPRGEPAPLLDELSQAELRIARYLPSNLKAPEIAAELCASANTVRTHIRRIYAKLDAHDRSEAVGRARELGLLAPSSRPR